MQTQNRIFLIGVFFALVSGLYAQTEFPAGDYWSLDGGFGMSDLLVKGLSYQAVIDPKLWLSPPLMVGSRLGVNFSSEEDSRNILTFEGQVYLRWNFLRLGPTDKKTNIFAQIGLGLISAYRGKDDNPFDDVTQTRGSLLADGALGVTIPLSTRWHIEPSVRGGYPHIVGFSVTAGYKFPLPQKIKYQTSARTEYVEIVKMLPPEEIIKRIMITSVEFILFGPDIGKYNTGIDRDAQQLNELVLNATAQQLNENSELRVRIEGHANPFTISPSEADELMTLSALRANTVADQLRSRGVSDEQIVIISFGGTRVATSEFDVRNRNRRVELIVIQVNTD
ncbi:MAG: OmpA family protein [Treponema sp.]|nr:OmpA family protein [Treponema sp.]